MNPLTHLKTVTKPAIYSMSVMAIMIASFSMNVEQAQAGAYSVAKRFIGLHERTHTAKLRQYVGVNPRSTPWCGAFVGAVVKKTGKAIPAGHNRAVSWRKWGKPVALNKARKGDVVVVRTKYGNHVGFYAGQEKGRVLLLGGNQSNQVKISRYSLKSVQSIRR